MATLYERNGVYYAQYSRNNRQFRHSLRTRDEGEAKRQLAALTGRRADLVETPASYPKNPELPWHALVAEGLSHSGSWLAAMYQRTKDRATSKRIAFYLTKDQLREIALRSKGRCEFSCSPFSWQKPEGSLFPPFAPSLDRITPRQGYNVGNCRLICYAANVALSDWGPEPFERIAVHYFRNLGYHV